MAFSYSVLVLWRIITAITFLLCCNASSNPTSYPTLEAYPGNKTENGTMIWYLHDNSSSYEPFVNNINKLLKDYNFFKDTDPCYKKSPDEKLCTDMSDFGFCGSRGSPFFGYHMASPCVYLKVKMNDWIPEYYSSYTDLPSNMPDRLKKEFNSITSDEQKKIAYIHCNGTDVVSQEYIGEIQYLPTNAIYDKYLHKSAEDLIIAIRMRKPRIGILIDVQCRIWAKNVDPDKTVGQFGLLIDDKNIYYGLE